MTSIRLLAIVLHAALAAPPDEPLLPRELAPGVFVVELSDRHGSANAGWIVFDDHVTLVGAMQKEVAARIAGLAASSSGKPVRDAILTRRRESDENAARALEERGIAIVTAKRTIRRGGSEVEVIELGRNAGPEDRAVLVRDARVLFAGEFCVNGPRTSLPGSSTARWIRALRALEDLGPAIVVPGQGTIGGPEILVREERFLVEIRRQVSHLVAQGLPIAEVRRGVRIEPEWLVWMPYDTPIDADIDHVRYELASPLASDPFVPGEDRRALAVIGDAPHEPGHLEAGLRPAFEAERIAVRFCADPAALTPEALGAVQLLVILRDGSVWPDGRDKPSQIWMTPEHERAIVAFVEAGGGLLALHNSTGLYRDGGPYLGLLGGTYQGHGPLERFRVSVVDRDHPITRGVAGYEVADEQHTPAADLSKVHLLLESTSRGGIKAAAGWVRTAGKGRVAYLANGHTRDALGNPMFQRLLRNAARWCLRLEN